MKKKLKIKAGTLWVLAIFFIFLTAFTFMLSGGFPFIDNWEGKYGLQGGSLYHKIINVLVTTGYCTDKKGCSGIVFGEHANRVNLNIYGVNDRKVIAAIVSMVAAEGMETTGGVPVSIRFYSKTKKELMRLKSFTKNPTIILEVNK